MKFLSQFLLGLVIGARLAAAVGIDFDFIKRQAFSLSSSTVESVETSTTASVPTEITSIISAVPSTSAEVSSLAVPPPPPPLSVPPVETTSSEVASVLPPPESTTLVIPTPTLPPSTSTTAEATAPVPTPGGGGGDTGGGFGKACGAGYTYCGYILQGDGWSRLLTHSPHHSITNPSQDSDTRTRPSSSLIATLEEIASAVCQRLTGRTPCSSA